MHELYNCLQDLKRTLVYISSAFIPSHTSRRTSALPHTVLQLVHKPQSPRHYQPVLSTLAFATFAFWTLARY